MKWAEEARGIEWTGLARMLGNKDKKKEQCKKLAWQTLQLISLEVITSQKRANYIIVETMQQYGRSTSQPTEKGKKRDMG